MGQFITGEPEQLVFDEGNAQSKATLGAVKGSTRAAGDVTASPEVRAAVIGNQSSCRTEQSEIVKGIGSREVAAAEVRVAVAMDPVGAGLGYHIQDYAGRLTIFGVVVVGEDLEFLNFVDRGAGPVPSGNQLIGDVGPVHVVKIAAEVHRSGTDQVT